MDALTGKAGEILSQSVPGYHCYRLTPRPVIRYAGANLCRMLGCTPEDLVSDKEDRYGQWVYPGDRDAYAAALDSLSRSPHSRTIQYRLVGRDGSVRYVSDTLTSRQGEDGQMEADSVLTDITALKQENRDLQYLNDTIPCGFMKYTCEATPRITYINDRMRSILGLPENGSGQSEYIELYKQSVYLMIPIDQRERMQRYLNRVYRRGTPIAGEITVLRCDGTKAHLFGWVTKCVNPQGQEEFQSVCMDVTDRYQQKRTAQIQRYLKALTEVYDLIFELDFSANTAKCLYGEKYPMFRWVENIAMDMKEAVEKWIRGNVWEEDREQVNALFQQIYADGWKNNDAQPLRVSYRASTDTEEPQPYQGIFLKMEDAVCWFCCRAVPQETESLRSENTSLKENMQELMLRFTDGLAAFEIRDGCVTPLYASDNVCEFFGFTREEWLPMMQRSTPIRTFVSRSDTAYEDFLALLQNGEREFTYYDLKTETERRIRAICSQNTPGSGSVRYVMLYNMEPKPSPAPTCRVAVVIRTFGYFDVFVGDKPIAFRNKKSKELLALLVDRRGGYVTSEEAIAFLWEDEPSSPVTLARYRKVALRLKNILEEYGISEILESVDGKRRIVPDKVQCDLYDYFAGKTDLFKGSYLSNYSWGETTLAELSGQYLSR